MPLGEEAKHWKGHMASLKRSANYIKGQDRTRDYKTTGTMDYGTMARSRLKGGGVQVVLEIGKVALCHPRDQDSVHNK